MVTLKTELEKCIKYYSIELVTNQFMFSDSALFFNIHLETVSQFTGR